MTTGAERVPRLAAGPARVAARAGFGAGVTAALANTLVLAFAVLAVVRPGPVQSALWPLACVAAGTSAALLVPLALVLGGAGVVALGVASMALSALVWLLLATGLLTWATGGSLLAGSGMGLATWLVLVCRRGGAVPPRAARVGRRAGVAALAGTAVVAVGQAALPTSSTAWLAVLLLGGVPAALGWLAVPAWSLRLSRWLRITYGMR
jgi:hypothetical protein